MAGASIATEADIAAALVPATTALADWLLIAPVALPLTGAAALLMLRRYQSLQASGAILVLGVNLLLSFLLMGRVASEGPLTLMMGRWLPPFGIAFTADVMGAVLALTANAVALACAIYALTDIDGERRQHGFHAFFLLMMAGVNGAFLTGDIFNLYVWFEVLLIASFGLIVLGSEKVQLDGALKYAFLNLVGTTLFLIAVGYLYGTFGTLNMADIAVKAREPGISAPIGTIAALFVFAFAMKAAAFPVNSWLPASYHTPRIVVSALFAGLLTKVGVYAMLRVSVMILAPQRDDLAVWIAAAAIGTMVFGVLGALAQSDIRRLMGFIVVSGIGSMIAGVALGGEAALSGAIIYAVHSMLVMAGLYLAVGVIGARAGTFEMRELGGNYAASPLFGFAFLLLALSAAGLPPFSGFWPKLLLVRGALFVGEWWIAAAILVTALLTSLALVRVWLHAFWRGGPEGTRDGSEAWKLAPLAPGAANLSAMAIGSLCIATVVLGIYPEPLAALGGIAAKGLIDPAAYVSSVFGGGQ